MPSIGVYIKLNQIQTRTNSGHKPHSTEIIRQSKIGIPLKYPIGICLEPEDQGHSITFKPCNLCLSNPIYAMPIL